MDRVAADAVRGEREGVVSRLNALHARMVKAHASNEDLLTVLAAVDEVLAQRQRAEESERVFKKLCDSLAAERRALPSQEEPREDERMSTPERIWIRHGMDVFTKSVSNADEYVLAELVDDAHQRLRSVIEQVWSVRDVVIFPPGVRGEWSVEEKDIRRGSHVPVEPSADIAWPTARRCARCGHAMHNESCAELVEVCYPEDGQVGAGEELVAWDEPCGCEHFEPEIDRDGINRRSPDSPVPAPSGERAEVERPGPWRGYWNDWVAPFHACPHCGMSLNWSQGEDVFDRPLISTNCCGVIHQAKLLWPHESTVAADRRAQTAAAEK